MQSILSEFKAFLGEALSNVDEHYWVVHSANNEDFLRERVFCYELYHQMRKIQEANAGNVNTPYPSFAKIDLYAEPDKRGWAYLKKEEKKNPDFIFHNKGSHSNLVVMEVKCDIDGDFVKDFNTLRSFVCEKNYLQYEYGVFFLYGYNMVKAVNRIRLLKMPITDSEKIYVFTRQNKNSPLEMKPLNKIMEWH